MFDSFIYDHKDKVHWLLLIQSEVKLLAFIHIDCMLVLGLLFYLYHIIVVYQLSAALVQCLIANAQSECIIY